MRRRLGWLAAVITISMALAACGSSGGDSTAARGVFSEDGDDSTSAETILPASGDGEALSTDGAGGEEGVPTGALAGAPLVDSGRELVSTASVHVESDMPVDAVHRAVLAVEGLGGALFAEDSSYGEFARSTLTLKVPPENFAEALRDIAELGTVVSQTIDTDDVTEQVVDLESRIVTARTSVERLRGFLDEATTVTDIAALEGELNRREQELESLQGQLRTLADRVDLATIVLTVSESEDPTGEEGEDEEPAALPGFLDGLRGGWDAFTSVGSVALAVVGALLPWVPLALVVWAIVALAARFRRRAAAGGA